MTEKIKKTQNPIQAAIQFLSQIKPQETKVVSVSFLLGMSLMIAYYLLRPVRDAMASDWSDAELSTLWTINFLFSFVIIAIYGFFASKVSVKKLVSGVYIFFTLTFFVFYWGSKSSIELQLIDKAFYVWVSVFSLLQMSVFWGFMAEIYSKEQSKRLFGIITCGASIGAMVGPSVLLIFSDLGSYNLILMACLFLLTTLPLLSYLGQSLAATTSNKNRNEKSSFAIGGSSLSGFKQVLTNPFLLGIGLFLFFYTGISSFIYFELKNLMAELSRAERTEVWAMIDLATNTLTILAGLFLTSRLATKLGIGMTLALIPLVVVFGMVSIAVAPVLTLVVLLQITRRSGGYAITRPAREMLFTYVDQDTRFKAKQVLDVVVYRGGDVFWGWGFTFLTAALSLGVVGVALFGAGIAFIWASIGFYLGKKVEHFDLTEPKNNEHNNNH